MVLDDHMSLVLLLATLGGTTLQQAKMNGGRHDTLFSTLHAMVVLSYY